MLVSPSIEASPHRRTSSDLYESHMHKNSFYVTSTVLYSLVLLGCPGDDSPSTAGSASAGSTGTTTGVTASDDMSSDDDPSATESVGGTGTSNGTSNGTTVADDTMGDTTADDTTSGPQECGNGVIDGKEECDDGGESAACDVDCTAVECGDGTVNMTAGETCDDSGESETCDADCTAAECGDMTVNATAGEACDDGGRTVTCNADCTMAGCGDGVVNMTAGETCDDMGESMTCDADCTEAMCGDGVINMTAGEACDDMGESMTCDADCTDAVCGDGVLNMTAGEDCDDGNMVDDDGCPNSCSLAVSATCADLLTNQDLWGMTASGVDLVAWTSSTLHWIGCPGDGCDPANFYCNDDPVAQTLSFGTTQLDALRSSVDPGNGLGDTLDGPFTGCCNAPGGLCNAPDSTNNGVAVDMIGALCTALGYSSGMIVREEATNFCPEPNVVTADGQEWDSDFVDSDGYGAEYQCSGFL